MMGETETMLKIFLAEDEIVMREGIRNNIAWQEEGFEFVGEASDGELAYPMIQKLKPDILITDIRMPFMDGLELSRIVKQELPDTSILILSGYGEFDYAKEAISIGVEDYLLKPVTSAQLLEAIRRIAEKFTAGEADRKRQKTKKNRERLQKEDCSDISYPVSTPFGGVKRGQRTGDRTGSGALQCSYVTALFRGRDGDVL